MEILYCRCVEDIKGNKWRWKIATFDWYLFPDCTASSSWRSTIIVTIIVNAFFWQLRSFGYANVFGKHYLNGANKFKYERKNEMKSGLSSKKDAIVQTTYSMKALSNAKQFLSLTFFKMSTKKTCSYFSSAFMLGAWIRCKVVCSLFTLFVSSFIMLRISAGSSSWQ